MIKRLISIIVLVCLNFQFCFAGNGYEASGGDSEEVRSNVTDANENSENKIQVADDDYYKLLLNYPNPVTSTNDSYSYLSSSHGNIYQEYSLHPDLKIGRKIKIILKNGTVRKGELQNITNEFVYVSNGSHQKMQITDIAEIKFRKKGINGIIGAVIGLGIGVVVGLVQASEAGYTEEGRILAPLFWGGIGAGIGAVAGVVGDGGDPVTIVPLVRKE